MSFINSYHYEEYSQSFEVSDGDHRVTIKSAEIKRSKQGNDMLCVTLSVADSNGVGYVERYVDNDFFNKNMSRFFDAFRIQHGNFQFNTWTGKTAQGHFEHEDQTFEDKSGQMRQITKAVMKSLIVPESQTPRAPAAQNGGYQQRPQTTGYAPQNSGYQMQQSASPDYPDLPPSDQNGSWN